MATRNGFQNIWRDLTKLGLLGGYTVFGPLLGGVLVLLLATEFTPTEATIPFLAMVLGFGAVGVGLALVPSVIFAGYLGYVLPDMVLATISGAFAIGFATMLGIYLFHSLSGSSGESILARRPEWLAEFKRIKTNYSRRVYLTIIIARLSPHMPFAATNLMIAQLKLPLIKATLASWIGLLPRSLFAVLIGAKATEINDLKDIASFGWDGLATLILIAVVSLWGIKYWLVPKLRNMASA